MIGDERLDLNSAIRNRFSSGDNIHRGEKTKNWRKLEKHVEKDSETKKSCQ